LSLLPVKLTHTVKKSRAYAAAFCQYVKGVDMHKLPIMIILSLMVFSSAVLAADISGTWTISQRNMEGQDDSFDVDIKVSGEKLTITGKHSKIGDLAGVGTLKADDVAITLNATGAEGKGALSFSYTGKLSGNRMSGTKEIKVSGTRGGQGGAPGGGAPSGDAPGGGGSGNGQGGGPAGGGTPGAAAGQAVSNAWSAVKK
jgi:hypothetical protein